MASSFAVPSRRKRRLSTGGSATLRLALAALSTLAALCAGSLLETAEAKAQRNSLLWLKPENLQFERELGTPPALNSPAQKAEFDTVVALTKARTPEREHEAIEDGRQTLVRFLEGMRIDISKKKTNEARSLFKEATLELEIALHRFKQQFDRRRPYEGFRKLVKVCAGNLPKTSSFPSTHAATGTLFASLLAEAAPELKTSFDERAVAYGESRTLCGFHFPSDTAAGAKAGRLVAAALLAEPQFRARFDDTRLEIRAALGL
jgi:acid phosphatase (class A)